MTTIKAFDVPFATLDFGDKGWVAFVRLAQNTISLNQFIAIVNFLNGISVNIKKGQKTHMNLIGGSPFQHFGSCFEKISQVHKGVFVGTGWTIITSSWFVVISATTCKALFLVMVAIICAIIPSSALSLWSQLVASLALGVHCVTPWCLFIEPTCTRMPFNQLEQHKCSNEEVWVS